MTIEQVAFTLDLIGKILIGIAVVRVHGRVGHEMKIDKKVLRGFRREKWWTYAGILFLVWGWVLHVFY
jgi:hypothetical protein